MTGIAGPTPNWDPAGAARLQPVLSLPASLAEPDQIAAVAVFLERGNGAINAAPVAGKIFDYYFSRQALANAGKP